MSITETNNIHFVPPKEVKECFSIPVLYKQTSEYTQLMNELIMNTHCHICEIEIKMNNVFCSKSHYRIFNKYGYQSCVYFEKNGYCSHCC